MPVENSELLEKLLRLSRLLERLTEFAIQLERRIDHIELVLQENDYETL